MEQRAYRLSVRHDGHLGDARVILLSRTGPGLVTLTSVECLQAVLGAHEQQHVSLKAHRRLRSPKHAQGYIPRVYNCDISDCKASSAASSGFFRKDIVRRRIWLTNLGPGRGP
eukprot:353435-Chlamydomonas_euryale.AAC.12